ncbi:Uma2 family endonuclease [Salinarimonas soli]|uniref:Uma2 family endonuclease n=2 Tax=Salinarimonas soli TaxID=1638099 RepID=A0A5B2VAJ4_9HYPH|nr:Uma2 family endonuclease [Salinarimonas soli]
MSLDDFEEALADKPSDERWELIGGRVVRMMVGARWEHARIVNNLSRHVGNALDAAGSSCQVFTETFYLKSRPLEAAMLPDVMVVCGSLEPGATSASDPAVLVEVMSVGSEARDRYEKWHVYRQLPSLRHYVLVTRDRPLVEVFDRAGEVWTNRELEGLDAALDLPAIGVSLPLRDIYARVFG